MTPTKHLIIQIQYFHFFANSKIIVVIVITSLFTMWVHDNWPPQPDREPIGRQLGNKLIRSQLAWFER